MKKAFHDNTDGDIKFVPNGAGQVIINDDTKLTFVASEDASIEYDEDGNDTGSGPADDGSNADENSAVYDTQHTQVSTYYRWDTHTVHNGYSGDSSWNQNCVNASCDDAPSAWTETNSTTGHGDNGQYDGSSCS